MSGYGFRRDGGEFASDTWRPLDRAVHRWVLAHGGCAALARLAAWASYADGQGDAALPMDPTRHGMAPLSDAELAQVHHDPLVDAGAHDAMRPFVMDTAHFYLRRNHSNECRVAASLDARRNAASSVAIDDGDLDALFDGDRSNAVAPQRAAVRAVVGRRLFVLTGGPGTGKTTTVLRMLAMLQRQAEAPLSIAVSAPTGKAAQRLVDALRRGRQQLLARDLPPAWRAAVDALPDGDALTLHRLLGFDPQRNAFRFHAKRPLTADVVVVDEASMVDLALLRGLLDAVRPDAALVLVGDADQLASVSTGSALMDVVSVLERERDGALVRLRHSFRAERTLVALNETVRTGDAAGFAQAVEAAGERAAHRRVDDTARLATQLRAWSERLAALTALRASPAAEPEALRATALAALDALSQQQLLCALREDVFGAVATNRTIERHLRRAWREPERAEWYAGRAVIVTRNDAASRLFNGDVGVCLADADGRLQVWFETADASGARDVRGFPPGALPPHEPAFAITVHKSQGSEYAHVAVLLPPDPAHRILSRQLLYTAVSRARERVELWSSDAALHAALAQPVERSGRLAERLARLPVADAAPEQPKPVPVVATPRQGELAF
ncbi:exodeoxyribonuclease V subunit alpha [Cognatilysobacter bugurensis]|uniref:RecBCD enzyme subunit RecD n=1 Tax=Cognatilysobacter bugurensis TaxID=543356 RepID=A0A918T019_9GAMM|nr:exodeoxyribonuclease V subunit alpha [Lysobacter bugurensis]GHA76212.1 RecBCD enzyme subunit RecD [Lysobacter bugurensis]